MKPDYGTLSETIAALRIEGYKMDFNLQNEYLVCEEHKAVLPPDEFEIDAVYRFEGESDPDDESVLYAISSVKHGVKGLLVNAYGMYSDDLSAAMVEKLHRHIF